MQPYCVLIAIRMHSIVKLRNSFYDDVSAKELRHQRKVYHTEFAAHNAISHSFSAFADYDLRVMPHTTALQWTDPIRSEPAAVTAAAIVQLLDLKKVAFNNKVSPGTYLQRK